MFLVLIEYEGKGAPTWEVVDGPFKTEEVARMNARLMAMRQLNTFAIVESKGMIRRAVIEVLEEG